MFWKNKKYFGWLDKIGGKDVLSLSAHSQLKLAKENNRRLKDESLRTDDTN